MRRWILLVAAGLVAGGLAVAYWVLSTYRPLETSRVVVDEQPYEDGAETYYVLWLANTGRWPITITDVNLESDRTPLFVRTEVRVGLLAEDSEPFESFRLEPDERQPVVVVGHFDNCEQYAHGVRTRREVQLIGYRVLGIVPTEQEVELHRPVVVASPPDAQCPGRR